MVFNDKLMELGLMRMTVLNHLSLKIKESSQAVITSIMDKYNFFKKGPLYRRGLEKPQG